jgi:hypothetical protein
MMMGEIVQRISGKCLDQFLAGNVLRHRLVRHVVHDENAFLMGGVSGRGVHPAGQNQLISEARPALHTTVLATLDRQ